MIHLTPSQPASWTPAAQPVVAPVPAVNAVTPVSSTARDTAAGQSFAGRSDTRSPASDSTNPSGRSTEANTEVEPAPLLPRQQKGQQKGTAAMQEAAEAERKAEQEAEEAQEALAPRLQEMLSSVWQASAAVVDVVLGRSQGSVALSRTSEAAAPTGTSLAAPAALELAASANESRYEERDVVAELRAGQEPIAYTEQGASAWTPLEAGTLISRRV